MFSREPDASLLEAPYPGTLPEARVLPSRGNGESPRAEFVQEGPDQTVSDFQDTRFRTDANAPSLL